MRVLVACEFSGVVRDAFARRGHVAWSCDFEPAETPGFHYQGDLRHFLCEPMSWPGWDLMIAHPPCTYLCNSGVKHLYIDGKKENGPDPVRWEKMRAACDFYKWLWNLPIPRKAIENPVMHGHAKKLIGIPDKHRQTFQPYEFWAGEPGKGEVKRTCLHLQGLPRLVPTTPHETGRIDRVHKAPPGPNRWKERSRTLPGIGDAMADQFGRLELLEAA